MQVRAILLAALASVVAASPQSGDAPPSLERAKTNPIVQTSGHVVDAASLVIPPLAVVNGGVLPGAKVIRAELDAALNAAQEESAEFLAQHPELQHDPFRL